MTPADIDEATAPARWLLAQCQEGAPLTQTNALGRSLVREAAERWPQWWRADLFGVPHRETDLALLHVLHDGLRRLRLVRRRGRTLLATKRGAQLADDPPALLQALADDLGGGDPFGEAVADAVVAVLSGGPVEDHESLMDAARALAASGQWRSTSGELPPEQAISWYVGDVLRRGDAYGLVWRDRDVVTLRSGRMPTSLTAAGRQVLVDLRDVAPAPGAAPAPVAAGGPVLVFDAALQRVSGVGARLAVGAQQPLTALHDAIQEAFGWYDDHLYSFWLDGKFWGDEEHEFTSPITPDHGVRTADVPLSELDLAVGAKIAYVFDFGDEWRVRLTLRGTEAGDGGAYPRVLSRRGTAPPQYPSA